MVKTSPAKPLVIFEMANNHMGDLEHGLRMVDAFGQVADRYREHFAFAFKLQYRDLDTFIHPEFRDRTDLKHIRRFQETRLTPEAFQQLLARFEQRGFQKICSAFDERSVDLLEQHGCQWIKVASCSLGDWPLMERVAQSTLPIILSTAGSSWETLDRVVSFFEHRSRETTLLHCVGEYPAAPEAMQLNQIQRLKERYGNHVVGLSSHESPGDTRTVQMALAKGAMVLEKHVGLRTGRHELNAYSCDPGQIDAWLGAARAALAACGLETGRHTPGEAELESLRSLRRGVYAKVPLAGGARIDPEQIFLAMPAGPGQLTANDLGKYVEFQAMEAIPRLGPILRAQVSQKDNRDQVNHIVERVRALLDASHTAVGLKCDVEISHHYGLDRFEQVGATILSVVNRAYCKKLIVLLPGQTHPEQYHKRKEETFHILHGTLELRLNGATRLVEPGDIITVERGVRHAFSSPGGCILEEISSTHWKEDSFYTDEAINRNPYRKTYVTHFFG
jgi:sialic acid synthase SpsE/quercetin dioxygenase-like cupin family protein